MIRVRTTIRQRCLDLAKRNLSQRKRTRRPLGIFMMLLLITAAAGTLTTAGGGERPLVAYAAPASITGKADIIITNKQQAYHEGAVAQCKATIHLPDGSVQTAYGHCISGMNYAVPHDGTYNYIGTLRGDGTYAIVIHSHVSSPANPGAFAPGQMWGTQQMGGINLHYEPKVTVRFTKTSADLSTTNGNGAYRLDGAVYDIHEAAGGRKVATITTDKQGHASCSLKPNTSYYAVEVKSPSGFTLNKKRVDFSTNEEGGSVSLSDMPGTIRLTVKKRDSATGSGAQPGTTLEGARFAINSLSTPGWHTERETDKHGHLTCDSIPLGDITVTETQAPTGYKLDTTPHTYRVGPNQMTDTGVIELEPDDFSEHVIAFDIDIVKYCDSGSEGSGLQQGREGIQFRITSNTTGKTVGTLTTDRNGKASTSRAETVNAEATSPDRTHDKTKPWMGEGKRNEHISGALPYDAKGYTVHEVEETTPDGFRPCPDWTIDADAIADGTTLHYIVDNDALSSRIQLVKTDAASGQTVPLPGFTFQLLDEHKQPITQESWYPNHSTITEFTTDETGCVTLPEALVSGTYYIREVAAVAPYLILDHDVRIEIPATGDVDPITLVQIRDNQAVGVARLRKTCSDSTAHPIKTKHGNPPTPQRGTHDSNDALPSCPGLAGAEFDVVALEDIVSPDGTVQASKGQTVDHITTDKNGQAQTTHLPLGSGCAHYELRETKAPEGHALDPEPREFTLSYQNASTEIVYTDISVENHPTKLKIDKTITGSDEPLAGATFALWRADDQISIDPSTPGALAIRAPKDTRLSVRRKVPYARIDTDVPEGTSVSLIGGDAGTIDLSSGETSVAAGTYSLAITNNGHRADIDLQTIEVKADRRYQLTISPRLLHLHASFSDSGTACAPVDLAFSADDRAHIATGLASGTYTILINDADRGSTDIGDTATYLEQDDDAFENRPILLKGKAKPINITTDERGVASAAHLTPGTYKMRETDAPLGFIASSTIHTLTVDEDGMVQGDAEHAVRVDNDCTKVQISKRDITNEAEIPGAKLSIIDSKGAIIATWTSTNEPHRIDRLAPGSYTLVEEQTPHEYDQAQCVPFDVLPTGAIQTVVMHDKPIKISGQIDKRQEIVRPTAPSTQENGDGLNTAAPTNGPAGHFDYSIDFRNTSNTWTDEFTVTDDLRAATKEMARLVGITTPVAAQDYDGKLNVWYTTNQMAPNFIDPAGGNATFGDGHVNPWITAENNDLLGQDGRRISFAGWKLWARDVSSYAAKKLAVSDLALAPGEYVTGIRFEYGRVEQGFTTRQSDWKQPKIKDSHDDHEDVSDNLDNELVVLDDGTQVKLAPAILHMCITDAYRPGTQLDNNATVDLFRNGGGKNLEDHDRDRVVQSPRELPAPPLAQTGRTTLAPLVLVIATCLGLMWLCTRRLTQCSMRR